MDIGIYKQENDNKILVAVIDRIGKEKGLEGYAYDTLQSYKGDYYKEISPAFSKLVDLEDERVQIILNDLKEKALTLKFEKRVYKINKLLDFYKNEKENMDEIIDSAIIEKNILYYSGNIIDLSKLSYYDKRIMIIDGVKVEITLPEKIMNLIIKKRVIKESL